MVFGPKKGGYGRNTVKATLPYVLDPPKVGKSLLYVTIVFFWFLL